MYKMLYIYPFLTACALMLTCGCGRDNNEQPLKPASVPAVPNADYVVAMINSTPLTWADMDRRAMGYLRDEQKTNHLIIPETRMEEAKEHFRKRSIQAFAFKTVMIDAATKNNIKVLPKDRERGFKRLAISLESRSWTTNDFFNNGPMPPAVMHKEFEDGLIIDKYIAAEVSDKLTLAPDTVKKVIESITATNVLKRAQADNIRQQLVDGASFEKLAAKYSACKSSKKGGDLGEFKRGKMHKIFEEAAFSQKVGEIGPVIKTPYGFHIIKVAAHTEKQAATDSTPEIPESVRASHILIRPIPIDKKRITDSLKKKQFEFESKKLYRKLVSEADVRCFLYEDMQF